MSSTVRGFAGYFVGSVGTGSPVYRIRADAGSEVGLETALQPSHTWLISSTSFLFEDVDFLAKHFPLSPPLHEFCQILEGDGAIVSPDRGRLTLDAFRVVVFHNYSYRRVDQFRVRIRKAYLAIHSIS